MAIQKEVWVDYIMNNLFKDNDFINKSFSEGDYVLNGKVVHIPQAGGKPTVVKNRTVLPATVVQRTDTDVTYTLDKFNTDPFLIQKAEQAELSYDKMASILEDHLQSLREVVAEELMYKWAAVGAGFITRTTGANSAGALSAGATGTRKVFLKEDLQRARFLMNKQKAPKEGRVALIPSDMMDELLNDADLKKRDSSLELDMRGGVVARLYGFDLIERVDTTIYDNTGTPVKKLPGAASAVSDNQAVLCWHPNSVAKAVGTIDFFENLNDATYFGDIYSAEVRCGGRIRREDSSGILTIVQAHGA